MRMCVCEGASICMCVCAGVLVHARARAHVVSVQYGTLLFSDVLYTNESSPPGARRYTCTGKLTHMLRQRTAYGIGCGLQAVSLRRYQQ